MLLSGTHVLLVSVRPEVNLCDLRVHAQTVTFILSCSGCSSIPSAKPPTGLRPSLPLTVSGLVALFVVVVVVLLCLLLLFCCCFVVVATPAVVLLMTETPGRILQLHAHFSRNTQPVVHKFLFSSSEWLPALNKAGRKPVNHAITEPLAPVLIER